MKEMDKLQDLYDTLRDAREQLGEQNMPFHKFTELVKAQVSKLKKDGAPEVAFRVSREGWKAEFYGEGSEGREVKQGRLRPGLPRDITGVRLQSQEAELRVRPW